MINHDDNVDGDDDDDDGIVDDKASCLPLPKGPSRNRLLTTIVLIGAVLTVGLAIAAQRLVDALAVPAAELVRLALHYIAVLLVGAIHALGKAIADIGLGHAVAIAATELIRSAACQSYEKISNY